METNQTKEYKMSKNKVIQALSQYIMTETYDNLSDRDKIKISIDYKSEEVPGLDPHDCDYRQIFDGITLKVEKEGNTDA